MQDGKLKIAVVGSGISGLAAAWLLSRWHHVVLYEASAYLGGHTNTVDVSLDGRTFAVDTGFLVFNERTYPNLCALFRTLGVVSVPSQMTFSVRIDDEDLEWGGSNLLTLFAQKRNLLKPGFWGMIADILRFNAEATEAVKRNALPEVSIGDFIAARRFGRAFRDWYLLPMSAAIWSCPAQQMLHYPAATFLRFCHNHGLLQINGRPQWRTVAGGGKVYVKALSRGIGEIRASLPVKSVTRSAGAVHVETREGLETYDHVIMATHSDQSLGLLHDADLAERNFLAAVRYQPNEAWLHTDPSFLPRAREAWSAWNYLTTSSNMAARPVSVSYLINHLQPLPTPQPVIVTLNPFREPKPETVIRRIQYAHPIFDLPAVAAQSMLDTVQGQRNTWFCGAWTGYGFHEDGLKSALRVANAFGVKAPWQAEPIAA